MDIIAGTSNIMTADARPKWTIWNPGEVSSVKKSYRKWARRTYKHYLRTGRIEDFNRSQRKLSNYDFD